MSESVAVIQFAKFPKLGHVKTRLEPKLGHNGSYQLHSKLVEHVHGIVSHGCDSAYLFLDQSGSHPLISDIQQRTSIHYQTGSDLGERMLNALKWGLEHHDKAIIVGSDCAVLTSEILQQAKNALDQNDMVFIPAEDGGYVLVGASKVNPNVFKNIPWGTGDVMAETLSVLKRDQTGYGLLDALWDVDRPEDYDRLIEWDDSFTVV